MPIPPADPPRRRPRPSPPCQTPPRRAARLTVARAAGAATVLGAAGPAPRVPPAFAHGLAESGFTVMNLANNHANDYGATGQRDTLAALGSEGLRWTGKPGQITYVTVGPTRVAIIGFAPYPWAQDALNLGA